MKQEPTFSQQGSVLRVGPNQCLESRQGFYHQDQPAYLLIKWCDPEFAMPLEQASPIGRRNWIEILKCSFCCKTALMENPF